MIDFIIGFVMGTSVWALTQSWFERRWAKDAENTDKMETLVNNENCECCKDADSDSDTEEWYMNREVPDEPPCCPIELYERTHSTSVVFIQNCMCVHSIITNIRDAAGGDLDIVLNAKNMSLNDAEAIVNALLQCTGRIRVHVPCNLSGVSVLVALTAHELHMQKTGWLSPIDPPSDQSWLKWTDFRGLTACKILDMTETSLFTRGSWVGEIAAMMRVNATRSMDRCKDILTTICKARNYTSAETLDLSQTFLSNKNTRLLTWNNLQCVKGFTTETNDVLLDIFYNNC